MRDSDIILRPNIRAYSASSFNLAKEIMLAGEVAAREALPGLKHLAISESEFAKYYARRTSGDYSSPVIQELRFEGLSARHKYRLSRELALIPGQPLDRTKVDASLRAIFEEGELKRISYQVEEVGGQQILVIRSERKDWLRNQLRLGFSVQDDLDGGDSFSLGAEARFNDLHESGTYALVQLEMGQTSRLYSELVQPLSQQFPLFFSPSIELARRDISILKDGERVAEYERRNSTLGLDLGVSLGRFGEITSGWRWGEVDLSRAVGDPELVGAAYDVGEWVSQLSLDQFNDPDFPTEGYRVSLISTQARESLAGSENFDQLRGSVAVPLNYESFTLLLNAEAGMSSDGLPLGRSFTLGGPFDISGYPRSSLIADNFWVGRSIAFYRIAQGSSALFKLGGYVGTTLEVASLRTRSSTIGDERGLVAGSLFIGADTPLLPVYFGFGLSDTSESTLFLSIGRLAPRQR
jgi:NTE family protein